MPTLLVPKQLKACIIPWHQVPCLIALCCLETSKSKSFLFRTKPFVRIKCILSLIFPLCVSIPPNPFTYPYSYLQRHKIKNQISDHPDSILQSSAILC